jgi:hypothetical protein
MKNKTERFVLFAGHGDKVPKKKHLMADDIQGTYFSAPLALKQSERLESEYDWWAIFDTETSKYWRKFHMPRTETVND